MSRAKGNVDLVVAGAGADGHGVISGFRGDGEMTRAQLVDLATRAGLPLEWLPAPKDAGVQLRRAVQSVGGAAYSAEHERARDRQTVEAREPASRWMLVRRGAETMTAGARFGEIVLVATLYDGGEIEFDGDEGLATAVRAEFDARVGAERYVASDVTRWLGEVHRYHLDAVRYGFGWYVPRRHRNVAESICAVFWGEARWGDAWMDPPLPVASSAQLSLGLANGLKLEVEEVLVDLANARARVRDAKSDQTVDIGPRAAETYMVRLTRVAARVMSYVDTLGAENVNACRDSIHDAMIELDAVLDGGVTADWNGIWSKIENDRAVTA